MHVIKDENEEPGTNYKPPFSCLENSMQS